MFYKQILMNPKTFVCLLCVTVTYYSVLWLLSVAILWYKRTTSLPKM